MNKFRFASAELLDNSRTKNGIDLARKRLRILLDQGYIGRNYDSTFRLQNKPASYFLTPKGFKYLRSKNELSPKALHAAYNNKSATKAFINHCLNVFAIYRKFSELYPGRYNFLTKSELADAEILPKLIPDAYLIDTMGLTDFLLDSIEPSSQLFINRPKLRSYIDNTESFENIVADGASLSILLVCSTTSIEKSMRKYAAHLIYVSGSIADVFTTTRQTLMDARGKDEIWKRL